MFHQRTCLKILTKLTKEGMIHSSSGPKGGYSLSKNWEDISFLDIIHALKVKHHCLNVVYMTNRDV